MAAAEEPASDSGSKSDPLFQKTMSSLNGQIDGQIFVFFVITVAAAEVAVGLALIVALYRLRQTTSVDSLTTLKF